MSKEWKLVPVEPTDDMKEAGAQSCEYTDTVCAALCYEAMIAAAPAPPDCGDESERDMLRTQVKNLESALRALRNHDRVTMTQVEIIDAALSNNARMQS